MKTLTLKLFITGRTARSDIAIENLHAILGDSNVDKFNLNIVDVLENPRVAEQDLILATPTLVKISPAPQVRIIGDLSDRTVLLNSLGLKVNES